MVNFVVGQRWMSETEPELGLGTVAEVTSATVSILFPATGELRQYTRENPPLQRVRFHPGDNLQDHQGGTFVVRALQEKNGLFIYEGEDRQLPESALSDTLSVNTPHDRFLHGQVDDTRVFDLRFRAAQQWHRIRHAAWRGFQGGRIDLIPHQLYIAQEIAGRLAPRVLLADEVGLGKTIEACLILHRLLLTGRARRVLILVPEPLLHQWFVELLRRFNLTFKLFDEERCAALETNDPEVNPFLDDQLVLTSLGFLTTHPKRQNQARAAEWDLLVVDEAHHLHWTPQSASPEYLLVDSLARTIEGLLLLTATPEQLGAAGHFARLRLLDPDRYFDLDVYLRESKHYHKLAKIADKLLQAGRLTTAERQTLLDLFPEERDTLRRRLEAGHDQPEQEALIQDLLDRHGPGRVMFRNTRASMTGFPSRVAHPAPITLRDPAAREALQQELLADLPGREESGPPLSYRNDPRATWLVELLRQSGNEKFLLICRTRRKVEALDAALRERINVKTGLFHEGMSLLQRDRSAAWFGEEEGARLLLCSEIGSEGRNFQFAHHLVLFDLPLEPNLLEQRIGRLDRIGQRTTIHLHIPWVRGTGSEVLFRWFHEGLNAFEESLVGGQEVLEKYGPRLEKIIAKPSPAALKKIVAETRAFHRRLARRLAQGRDRLLELSSFRAPLAHRLIGEIVAADQNPQLDDLLLDLFDHFNLRVEELSARTYLLGGGDLLTEALPGLPAEGLVGTTDRKKALTREDIQFLSWDHPILTGALDRLLGSEQGTSCYALWQREGPPSLLLEAIFILECLAPPRWHADRFLPPTPVRVVVDQALADQTAHCPIETWRRELKNGSIHELLAQPALGRDLLPRLVAAGQRLAQERAEKIIHECENTMRAQLDHEATRLQVLRRVNPNVRPEEIQLLAQQRASLQEHLRAARLRLDALRLVALAPNR